MCLGSGAAKGTWLCDGCRTQRWLRATASPSRGTVSPPEPQSGPSSCPGLGTSRGEGALQPNAIGAARGVRGAHRRNSRSQSGRTRRWEPHVLLNVSTRSTNLHCLIYPLAAILTLTAEKLRLGGGRGRLSPCNELESGSRAHAPARCLSDERILPAHPKAFYFKRQHCDLLVLLLTSFAMFSGAQIPAATCARPQSHPIPSQPRGKPKQPRGDGSSWR